MAHLCTALGAVRGVCLDLRQGWACGARQQCRDGGARRHHGTVPHRRGHRRGHAGSLPQVFADTKALGFVALSGIAGALSWLFYFMALKEGAVSQVAPIDKLSVVFAVLLAILIFGDKISVLHGVAIALIAAGGLILAIFP